jgi:hypothetical protein
LANLNLALDLAIPLKIQELIWKAIKFVEQIISPVENLGRSDRGQQTNNTPCWQHRLDGNIWFSQDNKDDIRSWSAGHQHMNCIVIWSLSETRIKTVCLQLWYKRL